MSSHRTGWLWNCAAVGIVGLLFLLVAACSSGDGQPQSAPAPTTAASQPQGAPAPTAAPKLDFPTKPVTLIIPFAPGGGAETESLVLAKVARKYLPQELMLVTKPGAGGSLGNTEVAQAKADGYTLILWNVGAVVLQSLYTKVPYDVNTFIPISQTSARFFALITKSDSKWKTVQDLVADAKTRPGQITFSHSGTGGFTHTIVEQLGAKAGVKFREVPTAGGAEVRAATLGKQTDLGSHPVTGLAQYVKSGDLRTLAVFAPERLSDLPDGATAKEQGFDVVDPLIEGVAAPKNTPPQIVAYLRDTFGKIAKDADYIAEMKKLAANPVYAIGDDFGKKWQEYLKTYDPIIKEVTKK